MTGDAKYDAKLTATVSNTVTRRRCGSTDAGPAATARLTSDDELAYLSYDPLLRYEKEQMLRRIYLNGLRFTFKQVRLDMNPLWNYITVASGGKRMWSSIRNDAQRTLDRIPNDLIEWGVTNSHRIDVSSAGEGLVRPHPTTETLAPEMSGRSRSGTAIRIGRTPEARVIVKTTARFFCCRIGWGVTTSGWSNEGGWTAFVSCLKGVQEMCGVTCSSGPALFRESWCMLRLRFRQRRLVRRGFDASQP